MSDYNIIQEGRHRGVCIGTDHSYSSVKGTPTISLGFRLSVGDADENRVITAFRYVTPNTEEHVIKDLLTLGWQGEDMGNINDAELTNEVELVIEHEEFEGKLRAKVKWINAIGGGMIKSETPMTEAQRADFGRQMKAKVREMRGGKKPTGGAKKDEHPNAPGNTGQQVPPPDDWS